MVLEPIPPEDLGLSPRICRELQLWTAYFSGHMDPDAGWSADADPGWYEREGERLAQLFAEQFGRGVAIDYTAVDSTTTRRFLCYAESACLEAAAAVLARQARHEQPVRHNREHGSTGWSAYGPASKTTFRSVRP